jgi:hypothetical protein
LEPRCDLGQPAFSFPAHPGHDLNTSRNGAPVETTRSLVPRLPFRDVLGDGGDEIRSNKNPEIFSARVEELLTCLPLKHLTMLDRAILEKWGCWVMARKE